MKFTPFVAILCLSLMITSAIVACGRPSPARLTATAERESRQTATAIARPGVETAHAEIRATINAGDTAAINGQTSASIMREYGADGLTDHPLWRHIEDQPIAWMLNDLSEAFTNRIIEASPLVDSIEPCVERGDIIRSEAVAFLNKLGRFNDGVELITKRIKSGAVTKEDARSMYRLSEYIANAISRMWDAGCLES